MRASRLRRFALTQLLVALVLTAPAAAATPVHTIRDLSLEFVGQVQNSAPGVTPQTHNHYGYFSYVRGVNAFKGEPEDETTALFTFYAAATTVRVISNGPLRVVTRLGTLTIYRAAASAANFADPDTFRQGTPVLVATFRQQSIVDSLTSTFTTFHQNRIVSTTPFVAGRARVQLGQVGETFTTVFHGHNNMPGPPSGWFAGYAVSQR
jgi:hypothetical protein